MKYFNNLALITLLIFSSAEVIAADNIEPTLTTGEAYSVLKSDNSAAKGAIGGYIAGVRRSWIYETAGALIEHGIKFEQGTVVDPNIAIKIIENCLSNITTKTVIAVLSNSNDISSQDTSDFTSVLRYGFKNHCEGAIR